MSASAQGAPCPRCHALGWVLTNVWSPLEICPDCQGDKYKGGGPTRVIVGICYNCKQEVNITGEPPCLPNYPGHVILSDMPPSSFPPEVTK